MDFLDTYNIDTQRTRRPEQSLNDEVSEVMGQLGRFWGGFKKQSQSALETARKDLSEVVTQAQKELTKLTSDPAAQPVASTSASAAQAINPDSAIPRTHEIEVEPTVPANEETSIASTSTSTSTLFSRLQSALPPNLLDNVRTQIPESLKHASVNIDLPQLRANFLTEFQRVQGITRAQAEEYAHKSETLFREAVKEAGEALRDAVKILPPEEAGSSGGFASGNGGGLIWDGSDMWSLPLEPPETMPSSTTSKTPRRTDAQEAVATRAESLFRRLRHDPVILRRDPAVDGGELYLSWVSLKIASQEGGIAGKHWSDKIDKVLGEAGTGEALKQTRDTLVPSELSDGEFWTRYFFRAHQIHSEEQKRKALLEGTLEEEDISWEDDDEETGAPELSSTTESTIPSPTVNKTVEKQSDKPDFLTASSPSVTQDSSEEYDVVSSGNVSPKEEHKSIVVRPDGNKGSSDEDSDWE
ncbi:hypothetical protein H2248_004756 [Termitomyces sp. 'cryptogamus']|nr:hypothetical protein H2248_004756 [Termitomyces sp. 'cryptogamus']